MTEIQNRLFALRDEKNAAFVAKLIPNIPPETILGVRTPALRKLAKELYRAGKAGPFLDELPHAYLEENSLHAFFLEQIRDLETCMEAVEAFLPYIDNWATCDSLNPPVFQKYKDVLLERVRVWLDSGETYKIRFGVKMLMSHFLTEEYIDRVLEVLDGLYAEEYYAKMGVAWAVATAAAKFPEKVYSYMISPENHLNDWTYQKALQKMRESYRVDNALVDKIKG